MSLAGNVNLLADRIADEFNAVRTEIEAKQDAPNIGYNTLSTGSLAYDAAVFDGADVALTGNVTLDVPTNGANHEVHQLVFYASGADRILTLHADFARLEGIAQAITVPSGKYLRVAIRKLQPETGIFPTVWVVEAAGVTQ
jgi:hypothetical protein